MSFCFSYPRADMGIERVTMVILRRQNDALRRLDVLANYVAGNA